MKFQMMWTFKWWTFRPDDEWDDVRCETERAFVCQKRIWDSTKSFYYFNLSESYLRFDQLIYVIYICQNLIWWNQEDPFPNWYEKIMSILSLFDRNWFEKTKEHIFMLSVFWLLTEAFVRNSQSILQSALGKRLREYTLQQARCKASSPLLELTLFVFYQFFK